MIPNFDSLIFNHQEDRSAENANLTVEDSQSFLNVSSPPGPPTILPIGDKQEIIEVDTRDQIKLNWLHASKDDFVNTYLLKYCRVSMAEVYTQSGYSTDHIFSTVWLFFFRLLKIKLIRSLISI